MLCCNYSALQHQPEASRLPLYTRQKEIVGTPNAIFEIDGWAPPTATASAPSSLRPENSVSPPDVNYTPFDVSSLKSFFYIFQIIFCDTFSVRRSFEIGHIIFSFICGVIFCKMGT